MIVIFSQHAYLQIQNVLVFANNKYETGGVLIGYKMPLVRFIIDITADTRKKNNSLSKFTLYGAYHSTKATKIISRYAYKPQIIGIWHSHICDDLIFSCQDDKSNLIMAKHYNGIISAIAMLDRSKYNLCQLSVFFVSPRNIKNKCILIINKAYKTNQKLHNN